MGISIADLKAEMQAEIGFRSSNNRQQSRHWAAERFKKLLRHNNLTPKEASKLMNVSVATVMYMDSKATTDCILGHVMNLSNILETGQSIKLMRTNTTGTSYSLVGTPIEGVDNQVVLVSPEPVKSAEPTATTKEKPVVDKDLQLLMLESQDKLRAVAIHAQRLEHHRTEIQRLYDEHNKLEARINKRKQDILDAIETQLEHENRERRAKLMAEYGL